MAIFIFFGGTVMIPPGFGRCTLQLILRCCRRPVKEPMRKCLPHVGSHEGVAATLSDFLEGCILVALPHEDIQRSAASLRSAFDELIGGDCLTDDQWSQACLPLRAGGCGLTDCTKAAARARMAAIVTFQDKASDFSFRLLTPLHTGRTGRPWSCQIPLFPK